MKIPALLITVSWLFICQYAQSQNDLHIKYLSRIKPDFDLSKLEKTGDPISDSIMLIMLQDYYVEIEFKLDITHDTATVGQPVGREMAQGSFPYIGDYINTGKSWYIKNTGKEAQPGNTVQYKSTGTHKFILGYDCEQFDITSEDLGKDYHFLVWATPQLPALVNPLRFTRGFPYGILGYYNIKAKEDTEAIELSGEGLEKCVKTILTL